MDNKKLALFLDSKLEGNEDITYNKLVAIDEIAQRLLQQPHQKWNEYDFIHMYTHIKHINKKLAYIKQIYDVINAIIKGILE